MLRKDIKFWFEYLDDKPNEESYRCSLCSRHGHLLNTNHKFPDIAKGRGIKVKDSQLKNKRTLIAHTDNEVHKNVLTMLKKISSSKDNELDKRKLLELTSRFVRTGFWFFRENIPFTKLKSNIELQESNGAKFGRKFISRKGLSKLLGVISDCMHEELIKNIRHEPNPISIALDMTTDLSTDHSLIIFLTTIQNDEQKSLFYRLIKLPAKSDADTIFNKTIEAFIEDDIHDQIRSQLISVVSDGEAVLAGHRSGVIRQLNDWARVNKSELIKTHCCPHRYLIFLVSTMASLKGAWYLVWPN